jgi:hypothetical protein
MKKYTKLAMGLSAVLGILCAAQSFAATTASESISYSLTINPTITANCPNTHTFTASDAGVDPGAETVTCNVTQNRPPAVGTTMRITSRDDGGSNAYGVATLTGAGADIVVTITPSSYSGMVYGSGDFTTAGGVIVNSITRGASSVTISADPAAIPSDQIPGAYTGANTMTFALL